MTDSNMTENATAEARRGDEALEAAKHLLTAEFFNDAISRAYYAAYHWSRALLFLKGLEPKTHRGVIQMIGLHYVKDGPLSDEAAALLAHLETYRELSDYTSTVEFTEKEAQAEIVRAEQFIAACRHIVGN